MPDSPDASAPAAYGSVLLKISGEAFSGEGGHGIEPDALATIARDLAGVAQIGVRLAVVVGGGNFIRGATFSEGGQINRATADYMGMLATVLNAVALQEAMEKLGRATRVMSAIHVSQVAEPFIRRRAVRHLEKGRAVILAGGTGNPYFTTDTCAAQRAAEIGADVLLKATKVDGIYSADPKKHPDAQKLSRVTYDRVLRDRLNVMDMTAFALCREQKLPLVVFDMGRPGNILRVVRGEDVGTRIDP